MVCAYTELCSGLTTLILLVCGLIERHVAHIELALTAVRAVRAIDAILRNSKGELIAGLFRKSRSVYVQNNFHVYLASHVHH